MTSDILVYSRPPIAKVGPVVNGFAGSPQGSLKGPMLTVIYCVKLRSRKNSGNPKVRAPAPFPRPPLGATEYTLRLKDRFHEAFRKFSSLIVISLKIVQQP